MDLKDARDQVSEVREQALLTSLRDAKRFPGADVTTLEHERLKLELGYDEIETELVDPRREHSQPQTAWCLAGDLGRTAWLQSGAPRDGEHQKDGLRP